jgi:hypothetical protein
MSHSGSVDFKAHESYPEFFEKYMLTASKGHALYFKILIKDLVMDKKNPVHFCRYEDLVTDPEKTLTEIFKFLLGLDDLEGTNVQKRIEYAVKQGK